MPTLLTPNAVLARIDYDIHFSEELLDDFIQTVMLSHYVSCLAEGRSAHAPCAPDQHKACARLPLL